MMLPPTMNRPPLARDQVRFVGDIVAVVVAETKAQAVDAAEAVIVDYDPLPAVVDPEAAILPTRRSCSRRRARTSPTRWAPARSRACSTTPTSSCRERIVNQRVAPVPMEPAGIVAVPGEPAGGLTFWVATQGPHGVRDELAAKLGLDPDVVRGAQRGGRRRLRRQGRA